MHVFELYSTHASRRFSEDSHDDDFKKRREQITTTEEARNGAARGAINVATLSCYRINPTLMVKLEAWQRPNPRDCC